MIILAAKSHQEPVDIIEYFIWRICVYYRKLKSNTKSFEFHITWCNDTIDIINGGSNEIWIISLDSGQGYHQVAVKKPGIEKLAIFHKMIKILFQYHSIQSN